MSKRDVHDFWQQESCGEAYAVGDERAGQLKSHARTRFTLEPYIPTFARFEEGAGRRVLEIGVGMGADHREWARHRPALLVGIDFTSRALDHTKTRLELEGCGPRLLRADAEHLPFADASFELVYSWGVLHHTPDTPAAIREVHRVLRPGGVARVMVYHHASIVGALLWLRYALLRGRPGRTLQEIYATHLESAGTKAYTVADADRLFSMFRQRRARPMLSFADLLNGETGRRHGGLPLRLARKLWPRWAIRRWLPDRGLYMLVEAVK